MIDLSTLSGLLEHDHSLGAYFPKGSRWSVLPLANLVRHGKGSLRLPIRVRCRDGGSVGQLQVRPPMPTWSNAIGWIELSSNRNPGAGPGSVR